jgi:hypothetical protein
MTTMQEKFMLHLAKINGVKLYEAEQAITNNTGPREIDRSGIISGYLRDHPRTGEVSDPTSDIVSRHVLPAVRGDKNAFVGSTGQGHIDAVNSDHIGTILRATHRDSEKKSEDPYGNRFELQRAAAEHRHATLADLHHAAENHPDSETRRIAQNSVMTITKNAMQNPSNQPLASHTLGMAKKGLAVAAANAM